MKITLSWYPGDCELIISKMENSKQGGEKKFFVFSFNHILATEGSGCEWSL